MAALQCLSSCFGLPKHLSIITSSSSSLVLSNSTTPTRPLSFSRNISHTAFSESSLSLKKIERPTRRSVVCEVAPNKKVDSAAKRARQAEKRRVYNKAKKSELKTRMKKAFEALDVLKKKTDAQSEEILVIEKLIAEAYSAIDKAVKVGSVHRNTGAHRKSRLARRKKAVEIHHGWYTPASVVTA